MEELSLPSSEKISPNEIALATGDPRGTRSERYARVKNAAYREAGTNYNTN